MNETRIKQFLIEYDQLLLLRQRKQIKNKPNFIGVGVGRCGTTSIYKYLDNHPDVYMSPIKEINYFGIRNNERNPYGMTLEEYYTFFIGRTNEKCIGEISPAYLTTQNTAYLIKQKLKTVKILIFIRDPIERAISQYKHHFNNHKIDNINDYFKEGIDVLNNQEQNKYLYNWFHPARNIMHSLYYQGIKSYLEEFSEENVLIIPFDKIKQNSNLVMETICNFLGVTYINIELTQENWSPQKMNNNLNLDHSIKQELLKIFRDDLEKLDSLISFKTSKWLDKYKI